MSAYDFDATVVDGNPVTGRDDVLALQYETGENLADLVALVHDPFLTGTPDDLSKARWLVQVVEDLNLLGTHQRGIHYALISHRIRRADGKVYGSDPSKKGMDSDQEHLKRAINAARDLGLVRPDAFPDKKSVVAINASYERDYEPPTVEVIPPVGTVSIPSATSTDWEVDFTRPTDLQSQPILVEITTEKDGIVGNLTPLAQEYGCRLSVHGGNSSKAWAYAILDDAIRDGRTRVVLMFTDADGAGESMPNATARHLEYATRQAQKAGQDVPRIYLQPIGLTLAQVEAIERETGRRIPISPDVGRDEGRVELDALPFFAPGWIESELQRMLDQLTADVDHTDLDIAEEALEQELADGFAPISQRVKALVAQATKLLATPEARHLCEQLKAICDELDTINTEGTEIAAGYDTDHLPDPNVNQPDLDSIDWLLDTDRDYVDQLNAYRRREPIHRRRPELTIAPRPPCLSCGNDMRGRKTDAVICSPACYQRELRKRGR